MTASENFDNLIHDIDGFIYSQVTERGLDVRTEKAYRLDLEHLRDWMEKSEMEEQEKAVQWEEWIPKYFMYLSQEKRLRPSTISRKYRVIGYYLKYLVKRGILSGGIQDKRGQEPVHPLIDSAKQAALVQEKTEEESCLSKSEVDAFFQAIRREYEGLDSDFRRRVCLRDQIMMELLFYHGLEVSELLKMEASDYEPKTGILLIPKKRDKGRAVRLFSRELQEQMGRWLEEREYFEQDNEFQGRMFLSKLGRPLSMKMVINIFEKYRVLAGIEKECTPKDLKRSMKGYAWEVVREICG